MNKTIKLILIVTISLIVIDQMSKIMIQHNYQNPIGNEFFGITLVENTGMAFGMNHGNTKNMILTIMILLIVINFIRHQKDLIDTKTAIAISLILSGGMSNLIDRMVRGCVMDFIRIEHFAIFNIADIYIFVGWILLVISVIIFHKNFTK